MRRTLSAAMLTPFVIIVAGVAHTKTAPAPTPVMVSASNAAEAPTVTIRPAVLNVTLASTLFPVALRAQDEKPQQPQPAKADQPQQPQQQEQQQQSKRTLWIAKFAAETKAAAAVGAVQASNANALKYSNLFDVVKTFETDATQPAGTWSLAARELEYSGGSTATRALVGFGAGRAHITMEYTLTDPDGKVVWTQKIKTKPSFWGSAGVSGALQDQRQAMDEQAEKLISALNKFFNSGKDNKK